MIHAFICSRVYSFSICVRKPLTRIPTRELLSKIWQKKKLQPAEARKTAAICTEIRGIIASVITALNKLYKRNVLQLNLEAGHS